MYSLVEISNYLTLSSNFDHDAFRRFLNIPRNPQTTVDLYRIQIVDKKRVIVEFLFVTKKLMNKR